MAAPLDAISERDRAWEEEIGNEVKKIMEGPLGRLNGRETDETASALQANVQMGWTVAKDKNTTQVQERPRPPVMDSTISNLRGVLDRLEMENVNSVAVQEAQTSSYASKRAQIQSMLASPQQAVTQRLQDRQLCEKHVKALEQLTGMLSSSVERVQELVRVRQEQAAHHAQITAAAKELTTKNRATLDEVRRLVESEVAAEQVLNGGYHFDPVALRTQQPEDILRSIQGLATNLALLMDEKLAHADAAVENITAAFACPVCEEKASSLTSISQRVNGELDEAKKECVRLAEAHRELDEADREKVIALKKDLEDLEQAERVHKAAEAALQAERAEAQHVAKKMVGFYQNIPRTF